MKVFLEFSEYKTVGVGSIEDGEEYNLFQVKFTPHYLFANPIIISNFEINPSFEEKDIINNQLHLVVTYYNKYVKDSKTKIIGNWRVDSIHLNRRDAIDREIKILELAKENSFDKIGIVASDNVEVDNIITATHSLFIER